MDESRGCFDGEKDRSRDERMSVGMVSWTDVECDIWSFQIASSWPVARTDLSDPPGSRKDAQSHSRLS